VADALSRKTTDFATVKARQVKDRFAAIADPQNIVEPIEPLPVNKVSFLRDVDTEEETDGEDPESTSPATETHLLTPRPRGHRLIDAILQVARQQNDGELPYTKEGKLIVPEMHGDWHLRTMLIQEAHEPPIHAHAGRKKTQDTLKQNYHWPGIDKDVGRYVRNCTACRRNKVPRDKTPGLLHSIPAVDKPWNDVVCDGKDMPQDRHGYNYVWAFICRHSKFLITIPGKKTDTGYDLAGRYYRRTFGQFGLPARWYTDNGPQFIGHFMERINQLTGTEHRTGTPGQAATQGAVEITNQYLDQRLRFYVNHYQDNWSELLPALDFAHNSTIHDSLQRAPHEVMFGRHARQPITPPDVSGESQPGASWEMARRGLAKLWEEVAIQQSQAQERQKNAANKKRRAPDFDVGDLVMVQKKGWRTDRPTTRLDSQQVGPYKILRKKGFSFEVDLPSSFKGSHTMHASRLRRFENDPLPGQHVEPPPPEVIDSEPEWEVERVEASRLHRGKLQYQVSWTGWDPDETYYDASNLKNSATRIKEFHDRHPTAPGPPERLQQWIEAAADEKDLEDHPDDNVPQDAGTKRRTRRHNT
jgi:hypothetical protein